MTDPPDKVRPQKKWSTPTIQKTQLTDDELTDIRDSADPEVALREFYIGHQRRDTAADNTELALGADQEKNLGAPR